MQDKVKKANPVPKIGGLFYAGGTGISRQAPLSGAKCEGYFPLRLGAKLYFLETLVAKI